MINHPIKQIMSRGKVYIVDEMETIATTIRLMDEHDVSALPVKNKNGNYVGVISRTDIAGQRFLKLLEKGDSPEQLLVRQLMNLTPPIYLYENQTVSDAIKVLHKYQIHRVFVADASQRICGIVSTTDIIRFLFVEK